MGVAAKHFYRFKYLKSDHWQNLRLEKLVATKAQCVYCWERDVFNDVHHLNYRKLYDVKLDDLIVLCRKCHDLFHGMLKLHKKEIDMIKCSLERRKRSMELMEVVYGKREHPRLRFEREAAKRRRLLHLVPPPAPCGISVQELTGWWCRTACVGR